MQFPCSTSEFDTTSAGATSHELNAGHAPSGASDSAVSSKRSKACLAALPPEQLRALHERAIAIANVNVANAAFAARQRRPESYMERYSRQRGGAKYS